MPHRLMNRRLLLSAALFLTLSPCHVQAGLEVDNNATFPDSPDIVAATPAQADEEVRMDVAQKPRSNNRSDISAGQSFTPSKTIQLDKIFIGYTMATDGQPIKLRIIAIDDLNAPTYQASENLLSAEATYTFSANNDDVSDQVRVLGLDLTGDDEITLEQGKAYVFEIMTGNDDGTIDFRWTRTGANNPIKAKGNAYIDREKITFKTENPCVFSFALVAKKE